VGAANFQLVGSSFGAPFPPGGNYPFPIHSIYITLLAETGFLGFILYTFPAIMVVMTGLYIGLKNDILIAGIVCGLIGTFAFGAFDYLQLYDPTAFVPIWSLAGIIAGTNSRIRLPIRRVKITA
jgi:O-antigen ligase